MEEHSNAKGPVPGTRRSPVLWWIAGGAACAAVLAVLLLDPLHMHPVDDRLRDRIGGPPYGTFSGEEKAQLWTCGMHPQVIQDEPGQCPICGMNLTPVRTEEAGPEAGAPEKAAQLWTCGMHPQVIQDEPGQCPICGMNLTPVRSDAPVSGAAGGAAAARAGRGAGVTIDPRVVQNMNVLTAPVEKRDIRRQVRTVGYLDYDPEKRVSVTTKYNGFVEKVYVNYLGQPVKKGDPLFDIYSPELVQTEQELLSAKEYVRSMQNAPEDARRRAQALLEAARTRLRYWDITPRQIRKLEETGEVFRALTVVAPGSGLVMKRMDGLEGMAIRPGMEVLHLVDLSTLWLRVEIFEDQLPWIDIGDPARVTLSYFPGQEFSAKVRYIEPEVSEKTRTVTLTIEVENPGGRLRAGMYATVVFEPVAVRDAVTVPSQAVIRTGERNVVVLALGEGRFAPTEVTLGPEGDGFVQVLSGLDPGETVVTSAQFLLDSESSLREAIQKMISARAHKHD